MNSPAPANPEKRISLRPETAEDAGLLFEIFASTRQEELDAAGFPEALRGDFLRMQFAAQSRGYKTAYPNAEFAVILFDKVAAGRAVIHRAAEEIRLVDIALLPAWRGHGIGGELLRRLIKEATATGKPLRLSALKWERALHLYERLGFRKTADTGDRWQMEWRAAQDSI